MRLRTRSPRGDAARTRDLVTADDDRLAAVSEDAAHTPGGRAAGLATPADEAGVAAVLRSARRVLPVGAQSSLTGGATPHGDVVLATTRLRRIVAIGSDHVRAQPGVTLEELQAALAPRGLAYPPVPTYLGATVGGIVATNAAGAATFKYGTTRDWVVGLTVVLPCGDAIDIVRGETRASDAFELEASVGRMTVPVPRYTLPRVPKCSAGYFAAPELDLVDLFIGSEGTLGVITEVTLRLQRPAPAACLALVPCRSEATALDLVRAFRDAARVTWRTADPRGLDVAAIELIDRRSLELLREDAADVRHGLLLPAGTTTLLLIQLDLPPGTGSAAVHDAIAAADDPTADGPLARFCRVLDEHQLLDVVEIAGPDDAKRTAQWLAAREAVPSAVNARVARAKATSDPRVTKTAGDMIVPWDHFPAMLDAAREAFDRRGLDHATWGHASDGNVHPNVIPRTYADVEAGREALLDIGRLVVSLGGSPLAEHGVGRNLVKQALLRLLYGAEGIEQMRAVKRALDPEWKLAAGVLFPP